MKPEKRILVADIHRSVAKFYGLSPEELTGKSQAREFSLPRQIAIYLATKLTDRSLAEIGRRTGDRDHTTVRFAVTQIDRKRREQPDLDRDIMLLADQIKDAHRGTVA